MKLSKTQIMLMAGIFALSTSSFAGNKHKINWNHSKHKQIVYGKVIKVKPVYREVKVSTPTKECWSEPVTHTRKIRHGSDSAGSTLAGGILGGIIGHQFGKGRGKKMATAMGTIIGAQVGHDANRGSNRVSHNRYTQYEETCEVQHHVSYKEVIDSYRVTYRYKGNKYKTNMPYDPGKKIKLKLTVEPVF